MITLSELPDWLKQWGLISPQRRLELDTVHEKITNYRAAFKVLTYEELCYLLSREFTERKRPRRWMIEQLIGRLNTTRNKQFMNDVTHLRTWVFRK